MTTTTYVGFTLYWEDDENFEAVDTGFDPSFEMTVVYEDGTPLNYVYDNDPDDPFLIDVPSMSIMSVYFDGVDARYLNFDTAVATVHFEVDGVMSSATFMEFSYLTDPLPNGGLTGTQHFIILETDANFDLNSLSDWTALNDTIVDIEQASGTFGPGMDLDWSDFWSFVGSTEVDEIGGTHFDDLLQTGAGDDEVYSSAGDDTMDGGADFDELHYRDDPGGVVVDLDAGTATDGYGDTDTISNFEMVRGSMFDDKLLGNADKNQFRGLAGNDTIKGGGGTDKVRYDKDADHGGTNGVVVDLAAETATDGFGDTDKLVKIEDVRGTDYNDSITGNDKANRFEGDGGKDTMDGGKGNDELIGGGAKDKLKGGNGKDTLLGGDGNDVLKGGNGKDRLKGEGGKDTLEGGAGNDKLTGGKKSDTFVFRDDFGTDKITDFKALDDNEKIDLSDVTAITGFNDLKNNHMSTDGSDVVIDDLSGNTIRLVDVSLSDLDKADFIF